MSKYQLRCMNEHCGIIFSTKGKCLDGLSCTECRGPLFTEPYNPNVEHVPYDIKKLSRMDLPSLKQKEDSGMYLKRIVEKRLKDLRNYEESLLEDIGYTKEKLEALQKEREELRKEREELKRYL